MKPTSLIVLALVLVAGYVAGARWPQYYGMVMQRISPA